MKLLTKPTSKAGTGLASLVLSGSLVLATGAMTPASSVTAPDRGTNHASSSSVSPVTQTDQARIKSKVRGTTEDGRKVLGTFLPTTFRVAEDGQSLLVEGDLSGRIVGKGKPMPFDETATFEVKKVNGTDVTELAPTGTTMRPSAATGPMSAVAAAAPVSCDVLNLVLGPLDLNLLGLEVHLKQVVLDIIAVPGALLGDLLCSVSNLLSGGLLGGLLGQLTDLLNQILGALGGLQA